MPDWIRSIPWWITLPVFWGLALMSAFAGALSPDHQMAGFIVGIWLFAIGLMAIAIHFALPKQITVLTATSSVVLISVGAVLGSYLVIRDVQSQTAVNRFIAYESPTLEFGRESGGVFLSGFNLPVRNAGLETINIHIERIAVGVNNEPPLRRGPFTGTILPPTQLFPWHFKFTGPPLQEASKTVNVESEVDYDTIPATGVRRSYRKIAFTLSWSNGHAGVPETEASIVNQWER